MANKRKSIRDYAVNALETAFGAGATIYNARYLAPKAETALQNPVITIFTPDDSSELTEDDTNNNRRQTIEAVLFVTGDEEHEEPASGESPIIDRIDAAAATIENTLSSFRESFGGLVFRCVYSDTTIDVFGSDDSGYLIGVAVIRFRAEYFEQLDS